VFESGDDSIFADRPPTSCGKFCILCSAENALSLLAHDSVLPRSERKRERKRTT